MSPFIIGVSGSVLALDTIVSLRIVQSGLCEIAEGAPTIANLVAASSWGANCVLGVRGRSGHDHSLKGRQI